jgi:hypothetical protein
VQASYGFDHSNGHRGAARQKAGAKKFIRTRDRIVHKNIARDAMKGEYE